MRAVHLASLSVFAAVVALSVGRSADAQQATAPAPETAEKVQLCVSCHGADGKPVVEKVPIIFGQHMFYLLTQLKDYRAGRRANEVMAPIASELSDDEMKALATYFAAQPWPNYSEVSSAEDNARAHSLAVEGQCTQCHLGGMLGDSRNPRLNHQKTDYLAQTMSDFRGGIRKNAAAMAAIVKDWSDADIAAMSRYLAGL
ncbi:c-type cytochrome [Mesorhizobium sp. ANAO-SY3R2]|uniref:c-type cytochrome n=1 Tax=Mesorhizobium sp. ANAO-SY3R2 TaxID=3166644 RepID=UPI00366A9343